MYKQHGSRVIDLDWPPDVIDVSKIKIWWSNFFTIVLSAHWVVLSELSYIVDAKSYKNNIFQINLFFNCSISILKMLFGCFEILIIQNKEPCKCLSLTTSDLYVTSRAKNVVLFRDLEALDINSDLKNGVITASKMIIKIFHFNCKNFLATEADSIKRNTKVR